MRKRTLLTSLVLMLVLVAAFAMTAYAADGGSGNAAWTDFWNGVGGFFYNALPWNWGNWMGK